MRNPAGFTGKHKGKSRSGAAAGSGSENQEFAAVVRRLETLRSVPERETGAEAAGRAKVLAAAHTLKQSVPFSNDTRLKDRPTHRAGLIPLRKRVSMKTIGIIGLVLALTFGGGATAVQASQDSLPNDLLYPVKLLGEDLQLGLTQDPLRDLELLMAFSQERVDEISTVLEEGEEIPEDVLDRLELHYQLALKTAAALSDAELLETMQQMQAQLGSQAQLFLQIQTRSQLQNQVNQQVVEQALRIVERNQVMVDGALEDPVTLRDRVGVERPETAPVQPENVPGAGSETGSHNGTGNGQGSGQEQDDMEETLDPEAVGTESPGQGQGGPHNGR